MFKSSILFISACILLMLFSSCEQSRESQVDVEVNQILEPGAQKEKLETITISNAGVEQDATTVSAMEKISPEVLATLDILIDDRTYSWARGPKTWDDELWAWKILLKWDKKCDYGPSVSEHALHLSHYTFIAVQCTSGTYQPLSYVFLLDKNTKENVQLKLGRYLDSTDFHKEVSGDLKIDTETNKLSILSVARGQKDCGTYQKFNFVQGDSFDSSSFVLQSTREQECLDNPADIKRLSYAVRDYQNWPLVYEINK